MIHFLPGAAAELMDAIAWYEESRTGLGAEFADEVQRILTSIENYPESHGTISGAVRCGRMSRFPYGIIYEIESETIVVIAVMHLHRRPEYWKSRSSEPR